MCVETYHCTPLTHHTHIIHPSHITHTQIIHPSHITHARIIHPSHITHARIIHPSHITLHAHIIHSSYIKPTDLFRTFHIVTVTLTLLDNTQYREHTLTFPTPLTHIFAPTHTMWMFSSVMWVCVISGSAKNITD